MKYLKTYEEVNNDISYATDDIIYVQHEGQQKLAKVIKINSKNSFMVKLEFSQQFVEPPVEICYNDIIGMGKSNSDPAMNNDVIGNYSNRISNDLVINGFPKSI